MGADYDFYVQLQEHDGWIMPEGFKNRFGGFREEIGYFVWFTSQIQIIRERRLIHDDPVALGGIFA